MSNILKIAGAGVSAAAEETDPNFNQTVLLLHGDGTDGAQNNTFLDSGTANSGSGFTITRNGNTTQGTFSPFSQPDGRWANFFDGNDHLSLAGSSDFNIAGDFTLEFWFYHTEQSSQYYGLCSIGAYTNGIMLRVESSGGVWYFNPFVNSTTPSFPTAGLQIDANTWYHVAVVRSGTTVTTYLNGSSVVPMTVSGTANSTSGGINIGLNDLSQYWKGYITGFKLVNGTAIAPSGLPTSPTSTSTTNQKLLTCYSNRFVDSNTATTAKTVTVNGNPKVTPFSPFAPTAAYSASVNGGSGYFDGTGDYLTVPSNAAFGYGTGDFSLEFWAYPLANSDNNRVIFHSDDNFNLELIATTVRFWNGSSNLGGSYNANAWVHVCITRESGTGRMFVDGVLVNNFSLTTNKGTSSLTIAHENSSQYFGGYLSNIRIVKGGIPSAYQTASTTNGTQIFTPQTTPFTGSESLTAGSVSLLLRGENAAIFDQTGKNVLETVGNAQIDTTTKKYGTGSLEFDGTGDWLILPRTQDLSFGTGDFTIEMWVNVPSIDGTYRCAFSIGTPVQIFTLSGTIECYFSTTDGTPYFVSALQGPASSISTNTWHHIAVVRNGTTFTAYVDGVAGTAQTGKTSSVFFSATNPSVGTFLPFPTTYPFTGFIDDLRITKGVARYTAAFTPPTKEFPNL